MFMLLNKWIVESAVVNEYRYAGSGKEDQGRDKNRHVILSHHFFRRVPGTGLALGKAAQIHGVADEFDPVQ
jgi:hypothetical protein